MGDYAENLQVVSIIFLLTIFIMSWDYVPSLYSKIKGMFIR
jgi:hypothetical protein